MKISCEALFKRYTYSWIIQNLTTTFEGTNTYGISGPNGSGKSTFLSLLSGFLSPSQGEIHFSHDGKEIAREDIYQYLSISAPYIDLIEEYTVSELLAMYRKLKPLQENITTDEFLSLSYLGEDRNKPIKYFSSGMKQRVHLLLAIKTDCPLLLLDEPSSFLDDEARTWLYQMIHENCADKLVIMASNDSQDLDQCDKIVNLESVQYILA